MLGDPLHVDGHGLGIGRPVGLRRRERRPMDAALLRGERRDRHEKHARIIGMAVGDEFPGGEGQTAGREFLLHGGITPHALAAGHVAHATEQPTGHLRHGVRFPTTVCRVVVIDHQQAVFGRMENPLQPIPGGFKGHGQGETCKVAKVRQGEGRILRFIGARPPGQPQHKIRWGRCQQLAQGG